MTSLKRHTVYTLIGLALALALAFFAAGPGFISAAFEVFGARLLLLIPAAWLGGRVIVWAIGETKGGDAQQ